MLSIHVGPCSFEICEILYSPVISEFLLNRCWYEQSGIIAMIYFVANFQFDSFCDGQASDKHADKAELKAVNGESSKSGDVPFVISVERSCILILKYAQPPRSERQNQRNHDRFTDFERKSH